MRAKVHRKTPSHARIMFGLDTARPAYRARALAKPAVTNRARPTRATMPSTITQPGPSGAISRGGPDDPRSRALGRVIGAGDFASGFAPTRPRPPRIVSTAR